MDDQLNAFQTKHSLPIPIPSRGLERRGELESWQSSLSQSIFEKEADVDHIKNEISSLSIICHQKEEALRVHSNDIKQVLIKLQKKIDDFSKGIKEDIANTKSILSQNKGKMDDLIPPRLQGTHLFQLFHKLHKRASRFFSNKEFGMEVSDLDKKEPTKNIIQSLFSNVIETEDDGRWFDWLDPIWSLEEHYQESIGEYEKKYKDYESTLKNIKIMEEERDALIREHSILLKERDALNDFSHKINEYRMSDDLPSDTEYLTPI